MSIAFHHSALQHFIQQSKNFAFFQRFGNEKFFVPELNEPIAMQPLLAGFVRFFLPLSNIAFLKYY